jgi:predicted nucleic acid-binding protein
MMILDTNVVSEMMRPIPQPAVLNWFARQSAADVHITAITMAEILFGIELLPAGKRRDALQAGVDRTVGLFAGHILSFDERAAYAFSLISSTRRKQGSPMSGFDAQIAAIARVNGGALATRNLDAFESCGLRLVNPWEQPS